jgi:hypothetical protein
VQLVEIDWILDVPFVGARPPFVRHRDHDAIGDLKQLLREGHGVMDVFQYLEAESQIVVFWGVEFEEVDRDSLHALRGVRVAVVQRRSVLDPVEVFYDRRVARSDVDGTLCIRFEDSDQFLHVQHIAEMLAAFPVRLLSWLQAQKSQRAARKALQLCCRPHKRIEALPGL